MNIIRVVSRAVLVMLLSCGTSLASELNVDILTVNSNATFNGNFKVVGNIQPDITSGLVLWYDFANTTLPIPDLSGNGNTGGVLGATWQTAGFTNGGCYSFDGVNDSIQSPSSSLSLNLTNELTLMAWVKINPMTSANYMLICKQPTAGTADYYPGNWVLKVETPGRLYFASQYGPTGQDDMRGNKEVDDGQWHHIALTAQNQSRIVRLYIDGVLDKEGAIWRTPISMTNAEPVRIGRRKDGADPFNGMIDEVRIYNRVLNADELGVIYANQTGQKMVSAFAMLCTVISAFCPISDLRPLFSTSRGVRKTTYVYSACDGGICGLCIGVRIRNIFPADEAGCRRGGNL